MGETITMFHAPSARTQRASRDAFDRVWAQEGWVLVDAAPPAAEEDERLAALRAEADELGVKLHHSMKLETIEKKIAEARAAAEDKDPK